MCVYGLWLYLSAVGRGGGEASVGDGVRRGGGGHTQMNLTDIHVSRTDTHTSYTSCRHATLVYIYT